MPTAPDPDLQLRGQLLRRLGLAPRNAARLICGTQACLRTSELPLCGRQEPAYPIPDFGSPRRQAQTFHIPAALVHEVREKIQLRHRFEAAAAAICRINLRRFLKEKEKS